MLIFVVTSLPMKDKNIAGVLGILAGTFGVHKMYLGKWKQSLLYILFSWTGITFVIGAIEGVKYLVQGKDTFNENWNGQLPAANFSPRVKLKDVKEEIQLLQEWKERGIITEEDLRRRSRQILQGKSNFDKA